MRIKLPPQLPFPGFKWRWAVLTPTETLNDPTVFLGVLRAFNKYDGWSPGSKNLLEELSVVQEETNCDVNLVRTSERNLVRNSGQYWKALGVLDESHGKIQVTPFGKMLAEGKITNTEFSSVVIKTLELPNRLIQSDSELWTSKGIKIKPLELVLDILGNLNLSFGPDSCYLTPDELIRIVIPLSGSMAPVSDICECLFLHRSGHLDLSIWPDCSPGDNDPRMAREFLLFLLNYGYLALSVSPEKGNRFQKFVLSNISVEEIRELEAIKVDHVHPEIAVKSLQQTQIPANIERKKVSRELLERPYQSKFRKNVLNAFKSRCLITGVNIENVLEAAHIIPVANNGSDQTENGLCLRSDIHQLYDSGHLKMLPSGEIRLSSPAGLSTNYGTLPSRVAIPDFVNRKHLLWRWKYA